jgi:hypothetical protein
MARVIEPTQRRLKLEPKRGRVYDYSGTRGDAAWPERGMESPNSGTEAYKKRLENAFASSLAKIARPTSSACL